MNIFSHLRLFHHAGMSLAAEVDKLAWFLLFSCGMTTLAIIGVMLFFLFRYRARPTRIYWPKQNGFLPLEIAWTIGPLLVFLVFFGWGAELFLVSSQAPEDAMDILLVAKQWLWEFQHADGTREVDMLHVPAGRPIRLLMTSEDVIHSFYVPAFRVKQDVLPLTYSTLWFQADEPGTYRINCAEFCGMQHAAMAGQVVVLSASDYATWASRQSPKQSVVAAGREHFEHYGCQSCHQPKMGRVAPMLEGLYGSTVWLDDGSTVIADENYLRQSIVDPGAKIVSGFRAVMPVYGGKLTDREVMELVAYLKSLATYPDVPHDPPANPPDNPVGSPPFR